MSKKNTGTGSQKKTITETLSLVRDLLQQINNGVTTHRTDNANLAQAPGVVAVINGLNRDYTKAMRAIQEYKNQYDNYRRQIAIAEMNNKNKDISIDEVQI